MMYRAEQVYNANYELFKRRAMTLYNDETRANTLLALVREKALLRGEKFPKGAKGISWYLDAIRSEFLTEILQADEYTTDHEYIRRVFDIETIL